MLGTASAPADRRLAALHCQLAGTLFIKGSLVSDANGSTAVRVLRQHHDSDKLKGTDKGTTADCIVSVVFAP